MLAHVRPALVMIALMTLLTGVLYPLALTGVAQVLFHAPAEGSLARRDGRVVGSTLIAQPFARAEYLHGRPSAAGNGDDPTSSGGSNYGPLDPKLAARIKTDATAIAKDAPGATIPADAVAASGSGLDPDISPAYARLQADRIATARHAPLSAVLAVIDANTRDRTLLVLGEPRVSVLRTNLALDERFDSARR